jgi:hypothetical protein
MAKVKGGLVGFGFANDDEEDDGQPKELPHEYVDTLRHLGDGVAVSGKRVQSALTRVTGTIVGRDEWDRVLINWDNGNISKVTIHEGLKVIVIKENDEN